MLSAASAATACSIDSKVRRAAARHVALSRKQNDRRACVEVDSLKIQRPVSLPKTAIVSSRQPHVPAVIHAVHRGGVRLDQRRLIQEEVDEAREVNIDEHVPAVSPVLNDNLDVRIAATSLDLAEVAILKPERSKTLGDFQLIKAPHRVIALEDDVDDIDQSPSKSDSDPIAKDWEMVESMKSEEREDENSESRMSYADALNQTK